MTPLMALPLSPSVVRVDGPQTFTATAQRPFVLDRLIVSCLTKPQSRILRWLAGRSWLAMPWLERVEEDDDGDEDLVGPFDRVPVTWWGIGRRQFFYELLHRRAAAAEREALGSCRITALEVVTASPDLHRQPLMFGSGLELWALASTQSPFATRITSPLSNSLALTVDGRSNSTLSLVALVRIPDVVVLREGSPGSGRFA